MVELIDAVILDKIAPKEPVSASFDVGINEISYDKRYIFNFLMLRNQVLDSGTFVVNHKTIVPLDSSDDSLFVLAINSQNISMSTCFDVDSGSQKEKVKVIQEELITLRDMPLDSAQDRLNKLVAIFEILKKYHPAYVLVNKNNDVNKSSETLINQIIVDYSLDLTIITLDRPSGSKVEEVDDLDVGLFSKKSKFEKKKEPEPTKEDDFIAPKPMNVYKPEPIETLGFEDELPELPPAFDVVEIGGENSGIRMERPAPQKKKSLFAKKEKPHKEVNISKEAPSMNEEVKVGEDVEQTPKKEKEGGFKIDFHYIKKLFKKEWSSFLFILYGSLSTIFFFFVTPYQFAIENGMLGAIFLIGGILCYFVTMLIVSSLYAFMDKETISKKRLWYTVVFTELFVLLGMLIAFIVLTILKGKNLLVNKEGYKGSMMITGFIFTILIMIIPSFVKYIRKLAFKVKVLVNKNDNEEK